MKSINPGRGPSFMGGIMGIFVGLFGIAWTIVAVQIGGGFVAIFGIIFTVVAFVQAAYQFSNATRKNRYSSFDITEDGEEPDPFNARFADHSADVSGQSAARKGRFCPYCGMPTEADHTYCSGCGKKLP